MLRIAGIADVHYLTDQGDKKGLEAGVMLDTSLQTAIDHNVDLIANLGDDVSVDHTLTRDQYLARRGQCKDHYNRAAGIIKIHIPGNHDQFYDPAGQPYSMDIKGFHVAVFITPIVWAAGTINIPRDCLDWLEQDLKRTNNKSIVLNHIGFSSYEEPARKADLHHFPRYYSNDQDVRDIFAAAGNVVASIAGHRHRDMVSLAPDSSRPLHITQQSLVKATRDKKAARCASTHYVFDGDKLRLEHFGLERPPNQTLTLG